MSAGRIWTGDELPQDTEVSCDVCVVGSGAGGGWLAHELIGQGLSVVMLEEGPYRTARDFDMTEARAFPSLYQDLGNRTTDDLSVTLLQGRSVGGGTTVNWCASFRTPERILKHWAQVHGLKGLSSEVLAPHFEAVEKRLHIAPWPLERINANNRVLWDGLGKLGYERGLIHRNVNNCLNLGYCGMGCPVDAKQSTLSTVIPDAVEKGLVLYANVSARRIETTGRKATGVFADVMDPATDKPSGKKLVVRSKVVAVCGGAVNSPALLLRSGLTRNGLVGTRTWLHPVVVTLAEFEDDIRPFSGAPQSVYSHHFIERGAGTMGFFLEVPPIHPMLAAIVSTGTGAYAQGVLARLPKLNAMLGLCVDGLLPHEQGATVALRRGAYNRVSLNYAFTPEFWDAAKEASKQMARIQFAAGAKRVWSLHTSPIEMTRASDVDLLDQAPWEPLRVKVVTAHQMGGCRAGANEASSVVDPTLRYRDMDNLFVVDGSVLPTSLGVNPQVTIFALSRWASQAVAAAV